MVVIGLVDKAVTAKQVSCYLNSSNSKGGGVLGPPISRDAGVFSLNTDGGIRVCRATPALTAATRVRTRPAPAPAPFARPAGFRATAT